MVHYLRQRLSLDTREERKGYRMDGVDDPAASVLFRASSAPYRAREGS